MATASSAATPLNKQPRLQALCLQSLKRTYEMFISNEGTTLSDPNSQREKIASKILTEYNHVKDMPQPAQQIRPKMKANAPVEEAPPMKRLKSDGEGGVSEGKAGRFPIGPGVILTDDTGVQMEDIDDNTIQKIAESVEMQKPQQGATANSIVEYNRQAGIIQRVAPPGRTDSSSSAIMKYKKRKKPVWHAPWKMKTVISGHTGWVRCVSVEPGNEWFCTGAADRTIKLWDLATGMLKVTLTGHIGAVRSLVVSPRHSYLFSCGEDRMVKCWDLEQNKVIRHYHGHLNGIYCMSLHPQLDVLFTGGRDSCVRVWDIRTKAEVHVLGGHTNLVSSMLSQSVDPQVISGSADTTIKLWDLGQGKCMSTLTNHKKSVRAMLMHPTEFTFVSASADNIKKWKLPQGEFMSNYAWPRGPNNEVQRHSAIVNTISLNQEQVMMSGADNGTMQFWDFNSGYPYQSITTTVQPGSLESEAGIYASSFDHSGSRLITCEADKTVKIWWEDSDATPETHPIDSMWRPPKEKF